MQVSQAWSSSRLGSNGQFPGSKQRPTARTATVTINELSQ